MAMNVNDLLCVGAEPIAFVDYIAVPKPDPEIHAALGASLAEACKRARLLCWWRNRQSPGIVTELDLSGTALGWLPKGLKSPVLTSKKRPLIGLPSSGVHSNGYSLVRNVVSHCGADWTDAAPFPVDEVESRDLVKRCNLGEIFLNPTRIYCDPVVDLIQDGPCASSAIHAICHVTGGGLSNLLRLHDSLVGTLVTLCRFCQNLIGFKKMEM